MRGGDLRHDGLGTGMVGAQALIVRWLEDQADVGALLDDEANDLVGAGHRQIDGDARVLRVTMFGGIPGSELLGVVR